MRTSKSEGETSVSESGTSKPLSRVDRIRRIVEAGINVMFWLLVLTFVVPAVLVVAAVIIGIFVSEAAADGIVMLALGWLFIGLWLFPVFYGALWMLAEPIRQANEANRPQDTSN